MTKDDKPQRINEGFSTANLKKGLSSANLQTALGSEPLKSGDQSSEPKPNPPADKSSSGK